MVTIKECKEICDILAEKMRISSEIFEEEGEYTKLELLNFFVTRAEEISDK